MDVLQVPYQCNDRWGARDHAKCVFSCTEDGRGLEVVTMCSLTADRA